MTKAFNVTDEIIILFYFSTKFMKMDFPGKGIGGQILLYKELYYLDINKLLV